MRSLPQHSLAPNIFDLASNLLGSKRYDVANVSQKEALQYSVEVAAEKILSSGATMAVYPAVVFNQTMDKYRKFVALKNLAVAPENEQIKQWNKTVKDYKEENINQIPADSLEYCKLFPKLNKKLTPEQYNIEVDKVTVEHGMIFKKRKMITIKPVAEQVMQNLLYIYNQQLEKKNQRYIKINVTDKTLLEPLKLNSWKVTQLKRDGVKSLDFCSKTIRNHRDLFLKFEIFQKKHFAGSYRGVEIVINPEILVLKDLYFNKNAVIENQAVREERGKILPDNNVNLTRTFIKEEEKKQKTERPIGLSFHSSFTRTPQINANDKTGGAGGGENPDAQPYTPTLSAKLTDLILNPQEVIERLASKDFNGYHPININDLYAEASNGTMTNEEFHDLAIQDFLKDLQTKIYFKSNVYKGNWAKCYYMTKKQYGMNFTGNPYKKIDLVNMLVQMRWALNWAKQWFNKNQKINPLFPADYLDITRKTKNEIGFKYAMSKYNKQQESMKKYDIGRRKQLANADARKKDFNYSKKLNTELNRFFKNKITYTQLANYVENNLPKHFTEKLPEFIEKRTLKEATNLGIQFKV